MEEKKPAVNTTDSAANQVTTTATVEDYEAKVASLEAEKAKLVEETANWKLAALKAKNKAKDEGTVEDEDEKVRRIAQEVVANSKLVQLDTEKDALIKKALKENKELKLALSGKNLSPASVGNHTEGQQVADSNFSPELLKSIKLNHPDWTDKDIERWKKNYRKAGGR